MTREPAYLVCPSCEHCERLEGGPPTEGDGPEAVPDGMRAGGDGSDDGDVSCGDGSDAGELDGDEPAEAEVTCPACGSRRAYRHPEPALPDADSESYVKLDADSLEDS